MMSTFALKSSHNLLQMEHTADVWGERADSESRRIAH